MSAGVKGFGAKYHARKHNKLNDEPEELDIDDATESGLFSERCEKERWMEIHGDRRFPGTFYDFKDMAIQFGYVGRTIVAGVWLAFFPECQQ